MVAARLGWTTARTRRVAQRLSGGSGRVVIVAEPLTEVRTLTGAVRQQPWEYDRAPQTTTVTTGRPVAVVWGVHTRVRLLCRRRNVN